MSMQYPLYFPKSFEDIMIPLEYGIRSTSETSSRLSKKILILNVNNLTDFLRFADQLRFDFSFLYKLLVVPKLFPLLPKLSGALINRVIHVYTGNGTEWSPIRSVIIRVITDQTGRHQVLLPICYNHCNFRAENKCITFFVKELLIPSIGRNTSQIHPLWKIPSLVGSVVVAMVIVINYVIGGLS